MGAKERTDVNGGRDNQGRFAEGGGGGPGRPRLPEEMQVAPVKLRMYTIDKLRDLAALRQLSVTNYVSYLVDTYGKQDMEAALAELKGKWDLRPGVRGE